jgi:GNAT superfamily N-acetyltransferase
MQQWAVERGTFWALETGGDLPPVCRARLEVVFHEVDADDIADLTVAMNLPTSELIRQRLMNKRRCFVLRAAGEIVCYGWVTHGPEFVGELERTFNLHRDEAYIWHCGTVPALRGQRCYSALLSRIIYQLDCEGIPRLWIGASRQNRPSVRGFANAGFQPVMDLTYRRIYRLKLIWFQEAPAAPSHLILAAYRILLNHGEYRLGPLALGYRR